MFAKKFIVLFVIFIMTFSIFGAVANVSNSYSTAKPENKVIDFQNKTIGSSIFPSQSFNFSQWANFFTPYNVIYTLSLLNNTLFNGNFLTANGLWPSAIAYNPSNNYMYVANFMSYNVLIISGSTNQVIATVNVGSGPAGVAYDPTSNTIYVTNENSNNVSEISGSNNTVIATVNVGNSPVAVAYDSSNNTIYVVNYL